MAQPPLIPANWTSFPDEFRSRLGSTVGRQRCMHAEGHLLIVAHYVPEPDEATRRGILFWKDAAGEWKCSNGDPGRVGLSLHLDRFSKRLEAYEQQEQDAIRADDYLPLLEGLAPIVRTQRNFFETLDEARKAMPEMRELIDHRDRAYELSRQAELLYEDAKNSMDVAIVRRADEQAQSTHQMTVAAYRLNIMAALFFPFATLGAIFGTTLTDNWSWSQSAIPFFLFVLVSLISGLVLTMFVAKPTSR